MKLRHVVLLLLLANAGYAAWSQGLLRELGWGPAIQTDPGRLAQQVAPDAVTIQAYSPDVEKAAAAAPAPETSHAPAAPVAPEARADVPSHEASVIPNSPGVPPTPPSATP